MISKLIVAIFLISLSAGFEASLKDSLDDLTSAEQVADSFWMVARFTKYYATGLSPLILDGVKEALTVNSNITLAGYVLTY